MVDLTFAQGGMILGDGKLDCCSRRYATRDGRFVLWDHGFHCGTLKLLEGH